MKNMTIFVGSTNPVKVNAVINAASETFPDVLVTGVDVASGIDEQPRSDEETKTGAVNRAQAALKLGLSKFQITNNKFQTNYNFQKTNDKNIRLGVGLEGGVFTNGDELWSTVWVAVVDKDNNLFTANGARFRVPEPIAGLIKNGQEMGPAVEKLIGEADVRQKQGMIGVITNNFVDRTEEYSGIVKMALGLWYGREWGKTLS